MSEQKVRIGFVGAGGMGQMAHLRNYVNVPECEVVALAEVRPETGRLVAARYGIPKVYADHQEMLARERLDGVVASQMFDLHAALLPGIYGKVKHLFTEKPIAIGVEAGEKLAAAAQTGGTVHMVGYHKRSDPAVRYAKTEVERLKRTGELGKLQYVRLTMPAGDWIANGFTGLLNAGDKTPPMAREPVIRDLEGAAEGMPVWEWKGLAGEYMRFVNYYIHQVNLMRHLLGESYTVTFADKAGLLLTVEGASGVTGIIEMSPYCTTIDWQETALVAFQKGWVKVTLPAPLAHNRPGAVEIYRDPGKGATPVLEQPTMPWVHAMLQQARTFVSVCRGETAPPCDAAEAVEDLRAARAYIRLWKGK